MTSSRPFLLLRLRISFTGRPIFIQFIPDHPRLVVAVLRTLEQYLASRAGGDALQLTGGLWDKGEGPGEVEVVVVLVGSHVLHQELNHESARVGQEGDALESVQQSQYGSQFAFGSFNLKFKLGLK